MSVTLKAELDISITPETLRKYMAAIRKEQEPSQNSDEPMPTSQSPRANVSRRKEQNFPLSQKLKLSADQEFRPSRQRNE